jgi:putative endonuclease
MKYYVYVLQDSQGKLYKGMTNDLKRRFLEHKAGKTITTRRMSDIIIIYQECYPTRTEARKHEKYLKTAAGRRFLKKVLGQ